MVALFWTLTKPPILGGVMPNWLKGKVTDPTSSSFGKVNPTERNNARVVQMALKLYF